MQIATSLLKSLPCEWRDFKIGDLFEIECSKYHNPNDYKDGNIPYVARTTFNNGIIKTIQTNEDLYPANCIIIGAESAKAFYQKEPFLTGNKIYRLYLKKEFGLLNENTALFICALINKAGEKYNYTEAFISSRVEKEFIALPINSNQKPDLKLMQTFIENLQQEHTSKLIAYYEFFKAQGGGAFKFKDYQAFIDNPLHSLSLAEQSFIQGAIMQIASSLLKSLPCEWKEFKIGALFEVKSNPQLNKDSFEFDENAEYPYFTRTVFNNGILGYVKYLDEEHKIKGNAIAVGLIAMQFFYMEKDFYAGQFTKTIYPKFENFNKNLGLFFASLFNANKNKYLKNFVVKDFEKDFINTIISLPINSKGEADLNLMQTFIKELEINHTQKLIAYYQMLKNRGGGGSLISFDLSEYEEFIRACHFEGEILKNSCRPKSERGKVSQDSKLCHFERSEKSHNTNNRDTSLSAKVQYDNIQWQEFCFDSVFLYERGKRYKRLDHTAGNIPYISSSSLNNGIDNYVNPPSSMKIYKNKLTLANSGSVGTCFYHPYHFVASDHCMVIWLKDRELTRNTAFFLMAIFEKLKQKYSFDREINDQRLRAERISLPVYENKQIAFDFMELFIKALEKENIKAFELYKQKILGICQDKTR